MCLLETHRRGEIRGETSTDWTSCDINAAEWVGGVIIIVDDITDAVADDELVDERVEEDEALKCDGDWNKYGVLDDEVIAGSALECGEGEDIEE